MTDPLVVATVIAAAVLVIVSAFTGPVYLDDTWRAYSELRRLRREALRDLIDIERDARQGHEITVEGTAKDISKRQPR